MTEWIKIVILGVVEGITEFLPISSTGHLLVFSALLDFENSMGGTFEIFIQIGAVFAVIGYYRNDLLTQVRTVRMDPTVQHLWLAIVIAAIPAGITALIFRATIKDELFSQVNAPYIVGPMLILGGIIFWLIERRPSSGDQNLVDELSDISTKQALMIGIAQTLALVPGVSRSGASIVGGMLAGLDRKTATTFSFYLAIPVLGGATILDLVLSLDQVDGDGLFSLVLGTIVSAIVAWWSIGWLLRYVSSRDFIRFGYYRIGAGAMILALIALNVL